MALTRLGNSAITAGSVTQHVTATDLQPIKSDISALALREATNESSAAFNLPNQFIDTFTDDTNLGTQTTVDRVSGFIGSVYDVAQSSVIKSLNIGGINCNSSTLQADNNTNFTQEGWVYLTGSFATHENMVFSNGADGYAINMGTAATTPYLRRLHGNGSWQVVGNFTAFTAVINTWYHFAYTKTASGVSYFVNGTRYEENQTAAYTYNFTTQQFGKGVSASSHNVEGYLTGWRISDVARYSGATYTVPTAPFVSDGNTLLLVNSNTSDGSTTFTDSSSNGHTIGVASGVTHSTDVASPLSAATANATGTLIQSANAVGSAKTKVGGTMLYKDNAGTATLGTDLKIYFTCDGGSNWTEATSYSAITPVYSTGIKQVRLGETTCTSGTDVRYKAVWANQASGSKETQLHGIGVNY